MRKLILIAGLVLASATAQAGDRSLSLVPIEAPAITTQAKAADTSKSAEAPQPAAAPKPAEAPTAEVPKAEAPKYVERPAVVEPKLESKAEQPKAGQSNAETAKPVAAQRASRADKPRRKRYWTESRIIGELHRHGIYW